MTNDEKIEEIRVKAYSLIKEGAELYNSDKEAEDIVPKLHEIVLAQDLIVADILSQLDDAKHELLLSKKVIEDDCKNDAEIRNMAQPIIGDFAVDGDSYEVPTTAMIVERLIEHMRGGDNDSLH